ncbi:chorismate--pyruvate lyase family protein [Wohlfahrtiimonas larvae]|uniref:Chorismate lyase n=1 Tax=Wohlfahrtiimonas larvae TaxID=1157986 RepID=A0ABP9MS84_9GAMM|nr:chorismate lyase [Wohlfahrtiimonas larvae]
MNHKDWYSAQSLKQLLEDYDYDRKQYQPLLSVQSLTQGLEMLNPNFSVELLQLSENFLPNYDNSLAEQLLHGQRCFSRRVILKLDNIPVIWAESLCDIDSFFWRNYLNCGTQSLGRKLFSGNMIDRTEFSYKMFDLESLPFELPESSYGFKSLIARQSTFIYQGENLCLTEWYLPNLRRFFSD